MSSIVAFCAKNRLFALLVALGIVIYGFVSLAKLPIDAVPDVTSTQVQVVTRAPALSATEMESQVTQPIERGMAGVPGLSETRSITKLGISIVTLVFDDAVDLYFARAQVAERLMSIRDQIPESVGKPELGPIATGLGEIFMFELKQKAGGARHPEELRTIVEWQVAPRLRQVPGVIEVVGYGGALKQYRVTLDGARLSAHRVSAKDVQLALESDNRGAGGGTFERAGEQIVLRGDARFRGLEDIERTVVRVDESGVPIRIAQLGEVDTGGALRQGALTRDGRGEIVGASVLMLKGQNSRDVSLRVKAAVAELAPKLPAGVTIEPYYDRSEFVDNVIKTITKNLSEGALIVILCLLLTLGTLRAGLLVAGAIPFSMLVGFIGLRAVGYSGNVMSLGAVDFGIVVEGAVLSIEHAMTHGANVADRVRRQKVIVQAMKDVARPALFVVTITALVFLPLATLQGVEGKMFRPVVISLCFMLLGAIVYATVVLPALAPTLLIGNKLPKEPRFVAKLKVLYASALERTLQRPVTTLAVSLAATAVLFLAGARLGADFMPRVFEGAFAVDAIRPPSTGLSQAIVMAGHTERAMKEVPEVLTVVNRIGRPEDAVDFAGPESSDVFVILKPKSEWRKGLTAEALMTELSERVDKNVPGTINAFSQPIEMRVNDLIAGARSDVVIKVFGDDLPSMMSTADQFRRVLATIPGATNVRMEIPTGLPSVQVTANRDRLARLGISSGSVLDTVEMSRAGKHVGVVREGERVFDLVLRLGGESVENADDVARLPIATPEGGLVPLGAVADIHEENGIVQIGREQMKRRLIVQANVRGRDMVGFVKEAQAKAASLSMPPGVEVTWGGQFQNFTRAKNQLLALVPVALVVIALMLFVTFRSAKYMVITVASLPFALAGGVAALAARGLPFSIPAGVGFVALCGVSVCTGIVMTENLLHEPMHKVPLSRVRDASVASLRARISTALIAAIGFVPAAIATGTGSEVQRPLATVVIGGLLASMVISLFALPAMLLFAARHDERLAREPKPSTIPPGPLGSAVHS